MQWLETFKSMLIKIHWLWLEISRDLISESTNAHRIFWPLKLKHKVVYLIREMKDKKWMETRSSVTCVVVQCHCVPLETFCMLACTAQPIYLL